MSLIIVAEKSPIWQGASRKSIPVQIDPSYYSQTISDFIGFDKAEISFTTDEITASNWMDNGIGRHVSVNDSEAWEGFVNKVQVNIGGQSKTAGPMMSITNNLAVEYSGVTINTDPPVKIPGGITDFVSNRRSVERYGTISRVFSGGSRMPSEAEELADTLVNYKSSFSGKDNINIPASGNQLQVRLSCLGYGHLLSVIIYNQVIGYGLIRANEKIIDVIDSDPDNRFQHVSESTIKDSGILVQQFEDENRDALSIIKEIVVRGGSSNEKWVFGVYRNRTPHYNAVPDEISYLYDTVDGRQSVTHFLGDTEVPYYNVRPGKYMIQISPIDIDVSSLPNINVHEDDRVSYVQSVKYTHPNSLKIKTESVDNIKQSLEKLGLGGLA